MHANAITAFSKLLGMLWGTIISSKATSHSFEILWWTIFSFKTTSNISTESKRSSAILKESSQIKSLYDMESVPVLNNSNKSKGDTHKVIFKTFGPKKASLFSLFSIGSSPPKIIPINGINANHT